jgi:hypothetical protein
LVISRAQSMVLAAGVSSHTARGRNVEGGVQVPYSLLRS